MDKSALTPVQRQASTLGQQIQRADVAASGQAELNKNQAQQFATETGGLLDTGMKGIYNVDASGKATGQVGTALANAQQAETTRQELLGKLQAAGTDSSVAGLSKLQQLLQEGGVNQTDMQKVFGNQDFKQTESDLQNALGNVYNAYTSTVGGSFSPGPQYFQYGGQNYMNRNLSDILAGSGNFGSKEVQSTLAQYNALANKSLLAKQMQAGLYGESTGFSPEGGSFQRYRSNAEGKLGDIAPSLLKSILAKSSAVGSINPTAQGVATDAQIANYNALNKLMGKTSSNLQTRVAQQNLGKDIVDANGNPVYAAGLGPYQAGKIGFDPNQL